ncbi:MAG: PfkB family carbohydrate kinase [Rhodoferax sp.]|nr:PfkB family carbohydrate kinase [Rhodoferax sp.]
MVSIFTAGGVIIDNIVTADGLVRQQVMGGNAVYSAAGARLWNDHVGIVALVPRNYPSQWLTQLKHSGIDTTGVSTVDESVECSEWFFYRDDGSRVDQLHGAAGCLEAFGVPGPRMTRAQARAFEAFLRSQAPTGSNFGAFRRAHPVLPDHVPEAYRAARGVHLAPNGVAAQQALARELCGPDRTITLDPGSHAAHWRTSPLSELLAGLDAVLPSEKELLLMLDAASPEEALRALVRAGVPVALVKRADAGSMFASRDASGCRRLPAIPVEVQDPTGAGDAFCGGFLAGLVATGEPLCAALCGTVSASFAIESFGPFQLLGASRAEAAARFRTLARQCELPDSEQHLATVLTGHQTP